MHGPTLNNDPKRGAAKIRLLCLQGADEVRPETVGVVVAIVERQQTTEPDLTAHSASRVLLPKPGGAEMTVSGSALPSISYAIKRGHATRLGCRRGARSLVVSSASSMGMRLIIPNRRRSTNHALIR